MTTDKIKKKILELYARLTNQEIHRSYCHNARLAFKGEGQGLFCSKCGNEIFETFVYGVRLKNDNR